MRRRANAVRPARLIRWVTGDALPAPGPARRVAVSQLVDTVGYGINLVVLPLFLIRVVHLSPAEVGLALTLGGAVGIWAGPFIGHLADRRGLRGVLVGMYLLHAAASVVVPFVDSVLTTAAVVCLTSFAYEGGRAVRHAVIGRLGGPDRATFRAQLRSITNIGISVGSILAGVAAQLDTRQAYAIALWAKALGLAVTALIQLTLPAMGPLPTPPAADDDAGRRRLALADRPYVAITAVNAVLYVSATIVPLGIPLWIASRHVAPTWLTSVVFVLNTVIVILFQVRMTRHVDGPVPAGRAWRLSGLATLATCVLVAATQAVPVAGAVALLIVAVLVFTVGEMWYSAASFELSLGLVPEHALGRYLGVYNLGEGIAGTVAPTIISVLCVTLGAPGWLLLGVVMAGIGALAPSVVGWAQATRAR